MKAEDNHWRGWSHCVDAENFVFCTKNVAPMGGAEQRSHQVMVAACVRHSARAQKALRYAHACTSVRFTVADSLPIVPVCLCVCVQSCAAWLHASVGCRAVTGAAPSGGSLGCPTAPHPVVTRPASITAATLATATTTRACATALQVRTWGGCRKGKGTSAHALC